MPALTTPAVDAVAAVVAEHARDDALITEPMRALGDIETLLHTQDALSVLLVNRVRAAYATEAAERECHVRLPDYLVREFRMTPSDAHRICGLARLLGDFPAVRAAFEACRFGPKHASMLIRVLLSLPVDVRAALEPILIEMCTELPPGDVAKKVDEVLTAHGYETTADRRRERQHATRNLRLATTSDGVRVISGTLTPEVGAKLEAALCGLMQRTGPDDPRTPAQRRHDALGEIADAALAHADLPAVNGERPRVVVHLRLDWVLDALDRLTVTSAWLDGGEPIGAETALRLCCDAGILPVVLGGEGQVLHLGRTRREPSLAQRRAAWIEQHGRCAAGGCRKRPVELHHAIPWGDGGPTDLSRLAWLCSYHHWLVHEGGWALGKDGGEFVWTSPSGGQRRHPLAA